MRSTRSSVSTWIDSNGPRGMFCSRTSSDCSGPSERTRRRSEPARPFYPAAAVAKKKASRSEAFRRPEPSPSAFRGEVGTATPTRSPSPAPLPRSAIGRNYPRGAPSSDMTLRYCLDCHGHHQSGYSCPQREARRYQASAARKARGRHAWRVARTAARQRDGQRCRGCGGTQGLQVHHVTPISEGGERYALDNLVTLCSSCHAQQHGGIGGRRVERLRYPDLAIREEDTREGLGVRC